MTSTCCSNGVAPSYLDVDAVVEAALDVHKADPYAHPELKQVRQVVTSTGTAFDPISGTQLRTAIDTIVGCAVTGHARDSAAHPELPQVRRVITDAGLTYDPANAGQLSQAISTIVEAVEPPDASETQKGVVRLANNAEAQAGALYTVAVHPAGLKATVDALINGAPSSLNTLGELASAIGNDATYATTVANQLALKAPLASPALTGVPTAPTPAAGDNSGALATTAFVKSSVDTAVSGLINGAPAALDTLNELAAALGNDASYAATITNQLALKAPLASPALTGVPTAPTPAAGNNSDALATTAFVQAAVAGAAPDLSGYARLAVAQSWTAGQRGAVVTLTDAVTVNPDFAAANNFSWGLGGNRTLGVPSNLAAGQSGVITLVQDSTGGRTLSFAGIWKFSGGYAPTLTTTPGAVDLLVYYVESNSRITARLHADVR